MKIELTQDERVYLGQLIAIAENAVKDNTDLRKRMTRMLDQVVRTGVTDLNMVERFLARSFVDTRIKVCKTDKEREMANAIKQKIPLPDTRKQGE